MKTIALIVIAALVLPGCAARNLRAKNPNAVTVQGLLIDAKGKDRAVMEQDGTDCASIAAETSPSERAIAGAVAGAVVGALIGALVYRSVGGSGNAGAGYGAGFGALSGGTSSGAAGAQDYRTVLRNCMVGRGHYPLN